MVFVACAPVGHGCYAMSGNHKVVDNLTAAGGGSHAMSGTLCVENWRGERFSSKSGLSPLAMQRLACCLESANQ